MSRQTPPPGGVHRWKPALVRRAENRNVPNRCGECVFDDAEYLDCLLCAELNRPAGPLPWDDAAPMRPQGTRGKRTGSMIRARQLRRKLAAEGVHDANSIVAASLREGISPRTMRRACAVFGRSVKSAVKDGHWEWPAPPPETAQEARARVEAPVTAAGDDRAAENNVVEEAQADLATFSSSPGGE